MAFNIDQFASKYKLHTETEKFLKARADEGAKPPYELGLEEAREAGLQAAQTYAGTVEYEGTEQNFLVPSIYCSDGVPITAYRSKTCDMVVAPPIVVYFHGGGNVLGCRQTHAAVCKILSRDSPCVVVNVEYRLAPECKFPANHNDAKCVVRWVAMNKSLVGGVNNSVVGVAGDSAGGRIAAVACHDLPNVIQFAVLVYPNVNFNLTFKSVEEFRDGPVLSKKTIEWFRDQYLEEKDVNSPRASPILSKDFSCLPATLVIVAELDPLRDGCYAYYEKLKQGGVKAQIFTAKGVPHGFWKYPAIYKECCKRAHEKAAKFIKSHSLVC